MTSTPCSSPDATRIDRQLVRDAFDGYVADYDATNPRIKLKIDHTYRVAALCDRISAAAGLSSRDIDLAWLCGMLHDIGRFEQVRRFDTFNDSASVSHAALGVEILFEDGLLAKFLPPCPAAQTTHQGESAPHSDVEILRTAIETHSDFRLPGDLEPRTRTFCDILRDADKIDILKASCLEPPEAIFGSPEDQMRTSPISPAVRNAFYEHRTVLKSERAHPIDYLISYACFVFELVYHQSALIAREQGHVFELLSYRSDNPDTDSQLAQMREHMRSWLDARVSGGC